MFGQLSARNWIQNKQRQKINDKKEEKTQKVSTLFLIKWKVLPACDLVLNRNGGGMIAVDEENWERGKGWGEVFA